MLTITETLDAIRAIDTDPDIILGACKRFINPEATAADANITSDEVSRQICDDYMFKKPTSAVIQGIVGALVALAAASCKPGHEVEIVEGITQTFAEAFGKAVVEVCRQQAKDNPEAATQRLARLMQSVKRY